MDSLERTEVVALLRRDLAKNLRIVTPRAVLCFTGSKPHGTMSKETEK
jgi:hypothetical protein